MREDAAVLLVECGAGGLTGLEGLLRNGYRIVRTGSTDDALRILKETPPALAVIELPAADRVFRLIRMIRSIDERIPVIAVSSDHEIKTAIGAYKAGATDYFEVPFDPRELLSALDSAVTGDAGTEGGRGRVLPVDVERLVQESVDDSVSREEDLEHALRGFRGRYIDLVCSRYFKERLQ